MITFDAIRSAHLAAITPLCKILPPPQLIGLWTLQGNLTDLSRYGKSLNSTSNVSYGNDGLGQYATGLTASIGCSFPGDFSFDCCFKTNSSGAHINFGNFYFKFPSDYQNWTIQIYQGTTQKSSVRYPGGDSGNDIMRPLAIYRISGTVYIAIAGLVKYSFSDNSTITNIAISTLTAQIQNLRLTGHHIGTSSSFPVPNTLYTGFEPI